MLATQLIISVRTGIFAMTLSAGMAYAPNPPTYQQIQTLTLELEAERKQNATNVRLIRQYETKIKWQEFELRQAQRQLQVSQIHRQHQEKGIRGQLKQRERACG
jgi:hypothetical protein